MITHSISPITAEERRATAELVDTQERFAEQREKYGQRKYAQINNRYRAAENTRFSRQPSGDATGRAADFHIQNESDFFRVIEIARSIDNDDMIVGQGIDRLVNNIMQEGFTYDPKTGDDTLDAYLKDKWNRYASNRLEVDIQQTCDFNDLAWLALRAVIVDGDILSLPLASGAIQMIEAHRLRTPSDLDGPTRQMTIHGVTVDENRRRLNYHICKDDISLNHFPKRSETVSISALDDDGNPQLLHLSYPKRVTQTRGITRLARITDVAGMHDDIQFAKLVQQRGVSCWTLIRERPLGFEAPYGIDEYTEAVDDPCQAGQTQQIRNISPGMWYTGYPGETVKGFSPNVPNPTFFDHAKQTQQIIALNLDLPLILMLMDAGETNFSGWRGAMEQAKIAFRKFQRWFAAAFHSQILRWKVRQWSTPGSPQFDPAVFALMQSGADVFAHEWVFPTWPYVEPLKDASADLLEVRNAINSPRRVQARRGRDWDVISTEIVEDNAQLIEKAVLRADEINRQFAGVENFSPISWQQLAMLPTPDGVQISIAEQQDQQQDQRGGNESANEEV